MITVDIVLLYLGMVLVAFISYAIVIPYFLVRRIKKMVETGELAEMIINALMSPIKKEDGTETTVAQLLISIGIQNLKMQFNALKSSIVRGFISDASGGDEAQAIAIEQYLNQVPRKWRWIVPLLLPMLAKMQMPQQNQPQQPNQGSGGVVGL